LHLVGNVASVAHAQEDPKLSSIDEVSHAIGALEASVANLTRLVGTNNALTEAVRDDVARLKTDVAAIKHDVGSMQPIVRKVEKWEQRVAGVAAAVAGLTTFGAPYLADKLKGIFGA